MNTTEVKFNGEIKSFSDLYRMAMDQFIMYEKLEGIEDWSSYDFSIDCSEDQMKFKDMLQIRFIEELTEASVSMNEPEEHFWEEVGDALNFFLSAYCMLGVDFNKFRSPGDYLSENEGGTKKVPDYDLFSTRAYRVIEKVGYLCNLLKNRPWTESNYLVSRLDFDKRLEDLWEEFWFFLKEMKLTSRDIFEMFYKKYKVNEHRRRTGY